MVRHPRFRGILATTSLRLCSINFFQHQSPVHDQVFPIKYFILHCPNEVIERHTTYSRSGKPAIVVIRNFSRYRTDTDMWIESLEANFGDRHRIWTREGWDMLLSESQVCADLPVVHSLARRNLSRGQAVMLNRDPETWYESVLSSAYKTMRAPSFLATV